MCSIPLAYYYNFDISITLNFSAIFKGSNFITCCNPLMYQFLNMRKIVFITGRRRSSLQKLHTLQLEAPITKVITLLSNAVTDTTNPETAAQIDKVCD